MVLHMPHTAIELEIWVGPLHKAQISHGHKVCLMQIRSHHGCHDLADIGLCFDWGTPNFRFIKNSFHMNVDTKILGIIWEHRFRDKRAPA